MRTVLFLSLVAATAACATTVQPQAGSPSSIAQTEAHERGETDQDRHIDRAVRAAPVGDACGDTVLNDQLTTGGLQVTNYVPCWDTQDEAAFDHVDSTPAHGPTPVPASAPAQPPIARSPVVPPTASAERQAVRALPETEIAACGTIPKREREHSPFGHRRSIAKVTPYYETGTLRGVRVDFKPVVSLTAAWLRQDIACHQAHVAVIGDIPDTMRQDPTLVLGAEITVSDANGHLSVLVRAEAPDQAARALAMAQGTGPSASVAEGAAPDGK